MRFLVTAIILLALGFVAAMPALGQDADKVKEDKTVTLTGNVTCAKCELKKTKACHTVIVVKEGDKEVVVYYFDLDGSKKYHAEICSKGKPGTVKGTVSEKDGKKEIKVSECKFD